MSCTFILSTRTCSCILLYDTDLKQWSDVHVEAQVGKPCSDDFGTSVMTVLPHFCHQQSRVSALLVLKFCNSDIKRKKNKKKKTLCYSISPAISMFMMAAGCCIPIVGHGDLFMLPELAAVSAAHHPGAGLVFAKHRLHGVSYFANRTSENQKRRKQKTRSSVRFPSTVI